MRYLLYSFLCATATLFTEEGMWPFNQIPRDQIAAKYGITLTSEWIERVQKASLRVNLGGSASFISPQGLLITNHHVGSRAIYNLSTEQKDLLIHGFYATSLQEELPCPNLYVDQLLTIEDVTEEILAYIHNESSSEAQELAKVAVCARIKERAQRDTGLQPEIISLYQGARYHLYLYRRYTDVRLVMAPEKSIAFFGGDLDNFEYPRYDLDVAFFRVYDQGKPLSSPHFLPWSAAGPKEQEPLFVAGHPGRTRRLFTAAHLSFLTTTELPLLLHALQTRAQCLRLFSNKSPEHQRIAMQDLFQVENSLKVYLNVSQGLSPQWGGWRENPVIQTKRSEEMALFRSVNPAPWYALARMVEEAKSYYATYMVLEGALSSYSLPYQWAKYLVRSAKELSRPSSERLKEYSDTELPALELSLFSTEPVYPELEETKMADSLRRLSHILGAQHPMTTLALAHQTPQQRARQLLQTTSLWDPEIRRQLYQNPEQIALSQDPLILLVKALDPYARAIRQRKETHFDHIATESYQEIAQARFHLYGDSLYPDATFSLRLACGVMQGYEQQGKQFPIYTNLQGAFQQSQQHEDQDPYQLPTSWRQRQSFLNLPTPFNFISTHDIIGGNSGSPVINANGEFVGLIFDGNRASILWDYHFDDTHGRAISVHAQAILEALTHIYQTERLLQEIQLPK